MSPGGSVEDTVSFGYKMAWLAIRIDDPAAVVDALGIVDAAESRWAEAVDAVYASDPLSGHAALVTPPLEGWVLVASPAYFDEVSDEDPDRLGTFVADVARSLGTEVQFFATHRVIEGHAWARADATGLTRAHFYLGDVGEHLVDVGPKTPHEETLHCLGPDQDEVPEEAAVMSVAGAWSVDPTGLEQRFPRAASCRLGRFEAAAPDAPPKGPRGPSRPWWKFW